ncbi:MAG: glucokinase [Cyanobacteria bacterium P01_H01_bin.121]
MVQLLAGDIGGTKTILRLVEGDRVAANEIPKLRVLHEDRYSSPAYPDLVPIVKEFLHAAEQQVGVTAAPQRACFAIAGPVVDNGSKLTNLTWDLQGERIAKELQVSKVTLINDFAAIGYGVLGLESADLHTLQSASPNQAAPCAVLGAGTGLGECFLVPQHDRYRVYSTEGGHADFAPRSEREFRLLQYLRDKHNLMRISVERVVSGQGVVAIYQFLRDRKFAAESAEVGEKIRLWEEQAGQAKSIDPGAIISQHAEDDPLCKQAMQMFVEAYGAEAGNLALKILPYGGLYIAGGIAAKNLPAMESGAFMQAFRQKGRMSSLLEQIPVAIVLNPKVGLIGAALYAAHS